jgi:peptidyl-tRNA hydrolase, PTH1 family
MENKRKLIVGLGNPGSKYKKTWHNMGFLVLDDLKNKLNFPEFKSHKKFQAEISEGNVNDLKVILAKPTTFMNNSGTSVSALAKFYKIDHGDVIVVHDDIDMELGKTRTANDSSAGGHNGIKSIIQYLNTQEFTRVKLGVRTDLIKKIGAENYVLKKYNLFQASEVKQMTQTVTQSITDLLS